MVARVAHGLARHARVLCGVTHERQVGVGAGLRLFLDALFGDRVERALVSDQQVVVGYDVYTDEARLVQLRELHRRTHGALRELAAVGRYQDVLEHRALPPPEAAPWPLAAPPGFHDLDRRASLSRGKRAVKMPLAN